MNKRIVVIVLAVVFAAGGILMTFGNRAPSEESDYSEFDESENNGAAVGATSEEQPAQIDLDSIPKIIAKVNGTDIQSVNYKRIIGNIKRQFEHSGQILTEEKFTAINNDVISNIVNTELLYMESISNNLVASEEAVETRLKAFKGQFTSEEDFKNALVKGQTTIEELRVEIRKSSTIEQLLNEKVLSKIKVTKKEAREYYASNEEIFKRQKTVRARHILLRLDPDADEKTTYEITKRMEKIVAEYNDGGKFEELAKKHSEGPSAIDGGDLSYFPRGVMSKKFEEAAFALKKGEVSDVVRTQFGLHLIELIDIKEGGLTAFKEIEAEIIRNLEAKARNKGLKEYIESLKQQADIRILI